jgi:ABC-type amino acid transport substrate-binding protein
MQIKRIKYAILSFLLFLIIISSCKNENINTQKMPIHYSSFLDVPDVTEDEIEAIEKLQKQIDRLSFGMTLSSEIFYTESGELKGFSALLCEWLSELFKIKFDPEVFLWSDLLKGMESGEIDFTGDMTPSDERREIYFMTDAIIERSLKYFILKGNKLNTEPSLENPLRLIILKNTTTVDEIVKTLKKGTYELILVDNSSNVYNMLKNGEADAYINENPEEAIFDRYEDIYSEDFFPFIYSPVSLTTQNVNFLPIISVVQKALNNGSKQYINELYNRGYQDYKKNKLYLQLTEEERNYIKSNPMILFAARFDNYPVSFFNRYENEWQGISFDVLREVEKLTGLSFVLANDNNTNWPELLNMLQTGKVSVISELIRSQERENLFIWPNTPFFSDMFVFISKWEAPNINLNEAMFLKVGIMKDTAYDAWFKKSFPNHAHTIEYLNTDDAFSALERGEVDLVVSSRNLLLTFTNYHELTGYKANYEFKFSFESSLGFNKDEYLLCSIVDKALHLFDVELISRQWIYKVFDYNTRLVRAQRPLLISVSVLFLFTLALLFTIFNKNRDAGRKLEIMVKSRTVELSTQQKLLYLINESATLLLESDAENIADVMIVGMQMIGQHIEIDRMYIWQNYKNPVGDLRCKQMYKWKEEDLKATDSPNTFAYAKRLPRWMELFNKNECVNNTLNEIPKYERVLMESLGVKSFLVIPIFLKG